ILSPPERRVIDRLDSTGAIDSAGEDLRGGRARDLDLDPGWRDCKCVEPIVLGTASYALPREAVNESAVHRLSSDREFPRAHIVATSTASRPHRGSLSQSHPPPVSPLPRA